MANGRIRQSRIPDLIAQFGNLGAGPAITAGFEGFQKGQDIAARRQKVQLEVDKAKLEMAAKKERERAEKERQSKFKEFQAISRQAPDTQISAGRQTAESSLFGEVPVTQTKVEGATRVPDLTTVGQKQESLLQSFLGPEKVAKSTLDQQAKQEAAATAQANALINIREKGRQDRLLFDKKTQVKQAKGKQKISALGKSKIFATEGFQNLVKELEAGEKAIPDSLIKRLGIKADSISGGNLGEFLSTFGIDLSNSEAILFDQQRESLAVAVYKFVSGDVGNIAASESKRALKLIPAITDSKDLRKVKIAALQRAADRARQALAVLINDPATALLSPDELDKKQRAIADQSLLEAALGVDQQDSTNPEAQVQTQSSGDATQRFSELEGQGLTEEQIFQQLSQEGF